MITFKVEECNAGYDDIKLKANDSLNLHDKYLYVMRKDGHYDIIYNTDKLNFDEKLLNTASPYFK